MAEQTDSSLVTPQQTAAAATAQRMQRVNQAYALRTTLTDAQRDGEMPATQANNQDEHRYSKDDPAYTGTAQYYASHSKGLKHNAYGEVDAAGYATLLKALESGLPADFAAIELDRDQGKSATPNVRLDNPQAGMAFELQGADPQFFAMPAAPRFDSDVAIGEMAELYWMAICRDVPFTSYATNPLTLAAAQDLGRYAAGAGYPRNATGAVDAATLFRGNTAADQAGPYLSQFLLHDVPYGAQLTSLRLTQGVLDPKIADPALAYRSNYMTGEADYLKVQRGWWPGSDDDVDKTTGIRPYGIKPLPESLQLYLHDGRGLANYVHADLLFQTFLNACLLLITPQGRGGMGALLATGNPYRYRATGMAGQTQAPFGTLGDPNFKTLVAEVASRAQKAIAYQKWYVHRRLRPEVFAARLHWSDRLAFVEAKDRRGYDFNVAALELLKTGPLAQAAIVQSQGLLPMAWPEGSPASPAYGSEHAAVAGACITLLKALFADYDLPYEITPSHHDGIFPLRDSSQDGKTTPKYTGTAKLSAHGELNKLAANLCMACGFAGIHWRSDLTAALALGEQVAFEFLEDVVETYHEPVTFTWTTLAGVARSVDNAAARSASTGTTTGTTAAAADLVRRQAVARR